MCSGLFVSDAFSQPIYIGSSMDLSSRIQGDHIKNLERNTHPHCRPLQFAWNKHGGENFVWWLMEECDPNESLNREQFYLDNYRPFVDESGGYNIAHDSICPSKGVKASPETVELLKKINKERFRGKKCPQMHTPEAKAKRAATMKIIGYHSLPKETLAIIATKVSKDWYLVDPDGNRVKVRNLREHCKKFNLADASMRAMYYGRQNQHKGWTRDKTHE